MNIILNYSNYSFVVSGATKEYKEQLMALGGKYNPHLKTGPGYIFPNKKQQEVTDFVEKENNSLGHKDGLVNKDGVVNKDLLSIDKKDVLTIVKKNNTIKSPLLSTKSSISYPNRFVGSDGLQYQIIIETCPLPYIDQKVTVKVSDDSFDGVVSNVNDGSPINDITLTYEEEDIVKQTRVIIINGKWQIHGFIQNHELIFHV